MIIEDPDEIQKLIDRTVNWGHYAVTEAEMHVATVWGESRPADPIEDIRKLCRRLRELDDQA